MLPLWQQYVKMLSVCCGVKNVYISSGPFSTGSPIIYLNNLRCENSVQVSKMYTESILLILCATQTVYTYMYMVQSI